MKQVLAKKFKVILFALILLILVGVSIWALFRPKLSTKLGYASDARLLIIHADDFGVCHAANRATIQGLEAGVVTSASLMVPCPGFEEAAAYYRENPEADIGLHLTFTSEHSGYHWGPVSPPGKVPSLVNSRGHFYPTTSAVWYRGSPAEIEIEMRAQIEKALATGVRPTHLDSHMGVLFGPKFLPIYLRVAAEYRLPAMFPRQYVYLEETQRLPFVYRLLQRLLVLWLDATGRISIDRLYQGGLDEYSIPQDEYYRWAIGDLKPGVSEVLVHLAVESGDFRSLGDNPYRRVEDYRIMMAPETGDLLESNGVVLIGYRPILELVRKE
jgi:predicted glycoside hydrolase/deacetylase ChbG (UPF0249 family)